MEEARKQDRLRKKEERKIKRECALRDKRLLMEIREKKRIEVQKYRAKKKVQQQMSKATCVSSARRNAGKKVAQKRKDRARKQEERLRERLQQTKRRNAVRNTQLWRLRVKMQCSASDSSIEPAEETPSTSAMISQSGRTIDMDEASENTPLVESSEVASPYTSYWKEYRAVKKVKNALPETPVKKARIVSKLIESPRTSNILMSSGMVTSPQEKEKIQVAQTLMSRIKENISEVKRPKKKIGDADVKSKRTAYSILVSTVRRLPIRSGMMKKFFGTKNVKEKHEKWWKEQARK